MKRGLTRRDALGLLSSGIAGLAAGCTAIERGDALPYVDPPSGVVPGEPRRYATSLVEDGLAHGVLVESREGRPIKVEGHPDHPTSLGGTGPREQAAVLGLYDPHRTSGATRRGVPVSWSHVAQALAPGGPLVGPDGAGVHLLLEPTSSPTSLRLFDRVRERLPRLRIHSHATTAPTEAWAGATLALGRPVDVAPDLGRAEVIATFGVDLFSEVPLRLVHARRWGERRRGGGRFLRAWAVESATSLSGAKADHRLAVRPSEVYGVLARVAAELVPHAALSAHLRTWPSAAGVEPFVRALAADLRRAGPAAAIAVAPTAPAWVHALLHVVHAALGGGAVRLTEPALARAGAVEGLAPLLAALDDGAVRLLVLLGGNPAYGAPADLRVPERLARAGHVVRLGLHDDESAALADWRVAALHDLERWGDARAADGTITLQQPLVGPLTGGHGPEEVLAVLAGSAGRSLRALVRETWAAIPEPDWRARVRRGFFESSARPPLTLAVDVQAVVTAVTEVPPARTTGLEVGFRPSRQLHDGRHASNAWLQELPDPITRIAWTNVAIVSATTATALGVSDGDLVRVARAGAEVRLPLVIDAGQADGAVDLVLGYGRRGGGPVADGIGADVSALRRAASPWRDDGVTITRVGPGDPPRVQRVLDREGRRIARHHTLDARRAAPAPEPSPRSIYGDQPHHLTAPHQWGMAVDLSACVGCGACVIACQAENNVPVVGPVEVTRGRVMHWIRVDRYVDTPPDAPRDVFQPMLCQHCEQAPCEVVCPVYATSHSPDGLNAMVYNRCVGTRFCSDNCPYKVRRFNWFRYADWAAPREQLVFNPDVSVRARGVMEKCTFCVQRIRRGARRARVEGRPLADGEIVTACAQACPSRAIDFGDLEDPSSQVRARHHDGRAYAELGELGTRPRVRYLAALRHPDPSLEGS